MADIANPGAQGPRKISRAESAARIARRKRVELILQGFGIGAILTAFTVLFCLVASLVGAGWTAFVQTNVTPEVFIDPAADARAMRHILSNGAQFTMRDRIAADPSRIGQAISITVPAPDPCDQFAKGNSLREPSADQRRVNDREIAWFDTLDPAGPIAMPANRGPLHQRGVALSRALRLRFTLRSLRRRTGSRISSRSTSPILPPCRRSCSAFWGRRSCSR